MKGKIIACVINITDLVKQLQIHNSIWSHIFVEFNWPARLLYYLK